MAFLSRAARSATVRMSMIMGSSSEEKEQVTTPKGSHIGMMTSSEHHVFGVALMSVAEVTADGTWILPHFLTESLDYIRKNGMTQEGIFRVSGISTEITELKARIDLRLPFDLSKISDIHSCTGLFKLYLRELPQPLIPFGFFDVFIQVFDMEDEQLRLRYLNELIWGLPTPHRLLFQSLVRLLGEITEKEDANKMSAHNLAVVFAPTIMRPEVEDALEMVSKAQILVDIVELLITAQASFAQPPAQRYHGVCRAIQTHDEESDEFLSFKTGELLWIQTTAKLTGWWLGHHFKCDPAAAAATTTTGKAFPNAAVEVLAEFIERMPARAIILPAETPRTRASRPPPPGAPKPASAAQRYDSVVDCCLELCNTVEQLYAQITLLQRQNEALAAHCNVSLESLVVPPLTDSSSSSSNPPFIENLKTLKTALARTKAPSKAPPANRQLLLKEIQNSPMKSGASSAPSVRASVSADRLDIDQSPRSAGQGPPPRLPTSAPPPLPLSLPPAAPTAAASSSSSSSVTASPPSPKSPTATSTPVQTESPSRSVATKETRAEKLRKSSKSSSSRSSGKLRKTKRGTKADSSGSTSKLGVVGTPSPDAAATESNTESNTTEPEPKSKAEPAAAAQEASNAPPAEADAVVAAVQEATESTPSSEPAQSSEPTPSETPSNSEPIAAEPEGLPSSESEPAQSANNDAEVAEDLGGEVLIACWSCDETNPWDNVSESVTCAKCGEQSLVQLDD